MHNSARCFRAALLAALALCLVLGATPPAGAQKHVALVIGNSAYQHAPELKNPRNDAIDIAAALAKAGYRVVEGFDLDKPAMDRRIRDFARALQGAEVGLFFYAGHGMQVGGQNYLVPIDAKLEDASGLDFEMVRLDLVHRTMEREAKTNLIFLDACRDNPLSRNLSRAMGTRSADIGKGLALVESGVGTLISFSTQPGNVALDGEGRNSPYAGALGKAIGSEGEDLTTLLVGVRNDVMQATQRRQIPWEHSSLTAKFYFTPPKPPAASPKPAPAPPQAAGPTFQQQAELAFWGSVKDSHDPAVIQTYLDSYPQGAFAPLARVMIEKLKDEAAASQALAAQENELRRAEAARRAAEEQKAAAERKATEEQAKAYDARREAELRKVEEELRKAQEAAKAAEAQRLAAQKATEEARAAAAAAKAAIEAEARRTEVARAIQPPKLEKPPAGGPYDGTWTFTRTVAPGCGARNSVFSVRIHNGEVVGPGGKGKLSSNGDVYVPGASNNFTGKLKGDKGSGTYSGKCEGTFTARREP